MAGAHEFRQHGFHARRRAEIISPLAQSETVGHEAADMAAQALGLTYRKLKNQTIPLSTPYAT
ncbi:hypothetical protein E5459_10665 [Salmonella enterica]|nr:hypothetical protein [Salmonella enterica]EAO4570861.1 hypothetical protein [Salmonella enterica]EAO4647070.1 hypothetical protein [Salmonella enterica]EAT6583412.1 hypothetical protein [Salmonella enterica]EAV7113527.1 hypothetical protein [Salmonella enterica]